MTRHHRIGRAVGTGSSRRPRGGQTKRNRLRLEILEPRLLLAAEILDSSWRDLPGSGSTEWEDPRTGSESWDPASGLWFQSFPNVSRIPIEQASRVDATYPEGFVGPKPLVSGEWVIQLRETAAIRIDGLASVAGLLDDEFHNKFQVIRGLGHEGLILVQGRGVSKLAIEASLSSNPQVDWYRVQSPLARADSPIVAADRSTAPISATERSTNWFEVVADADESTERDKDTWIVRLRSSDIDRGMSVADTEALIRGNTNDSSLDFRLIRGLGLPGLVLIETDVADRSEAISRLRDNRHVDAFERNTRIQAAEVVPNDPEFSSQLHLHNPGGYDISAQAAWESAVGNRDQVVAVVDSGIDYRHPDLAMNIWINQGEIPADLPLVDVDADGRISFVDLNHESNSEFVTDLNGNGFIDADDLLADPRWINGSDSDGNGFVDDLVGWNFADDNVAPDDLNGHGTHVAGVLAAEGNNGTGVTGGLWEASVMPLKFLDENNSGEVKDAVLAVNYANKMRRDHDVDVRVINNSWVSLDGFNSALHQAFLQSGSEDILLVSSAGNGNVFGLPNDNDDPSLAVFPASFDLENLVSVTGTDSQGRLVPQFNYGANRVHLAAPSMSIWSTQPGGGYGARSGTSFAAPQVSAAAMLVWATTPHATASEVRQAILLGTDPDPSLDGRVATGGRLNLEKTLQVDTIAPRARLLGATPPLTRGISSFEIVVEFRDERGLNLETLSLSDIEIQAVEDPAHSILPSALALDVDPDGKWAIATYSIPAPGPVWDVEDNGSYRVVLRPDEVLDAAGNPARPDVQVPTDPWRVGADPFEIAVPAVGTIFVDSFEDSLEPASLRTAVIEANQTPGDNTILLEEGTYALSIPGNGDNLGYSGDLDVFDTTGTLTIVGKGTRETTIDAQAIDRVFDVRPGATLILQDLHVTGGAGVTWGGGIRNYFGTVVLSNTRVTDNQAQYGGGVYTRGDLQVVNRTELHRNEGRDGGGIYQYDGTTTVVDSVLSQNSAARFGGGILNYDGTLTVRETQVIENNAGVVESGTGGGIDSTGNISVIDSRIENNTVLVDNIVREIEPNNSIAESQNINFAKWGLAENPDVGPTSETIPHITILGTGDGTFDYFQFDAESGDRGIFDIDYGSGGDGSIDTQLFLYGSDGQLLAENDDGDTSLGGTGSTSNLDSYIDYTFEEPGTYVIAVGQYPSTGSPGGVTGSSPSSGQTYSLQISLTDKRSYALGGGLYIGAIDGRDTDANIEDTHIASNSASSGGGVFLDEGAKLTIADSSIAENAAVTLEKVGLLQTERYTGGGGILVQDDLVILRSVIASNQAGVGGGIDIRSLGDDLVIIQESVIERNVAKSDEYAGGGGIRNGNASEGGGTLIIRDSTVRDNISSFEGGGITNGGTLSIMGSTITGNLAGNAGGLGNWGVATIDRSTISENHASDEFDPIAVEGTDLFYRTGDGGGVYNSSILLYFFGSPVVELGLNADLTITNSTIANNLADRDGAGLYVSGPDARASNTIFWNNVAADGLEDIMAGSHLTDFFGNRLGGRFDSQGHNLIGAVFHRSPGSVTLDPTDLINPNAQLGSLADNGGLTWTHLPEPSSPAIDRGPTSLSGLDQRGVVRPQDGNLDGIARSDIGSVERYFAEISGSVFNDLDSTGTWDTDDPPLEDRLVYVDLNENGSLDPGEPSETTNATGQFTFNRIEPGDYAIRVETPPLWRQTYPVSDGGPVPDVPASHEISVATGEVRSGLIFGNHANVAEIRGRIFNDLDTSGVAEDGEFGLQGWRVFLDLNRDQVFDVGVEPVAVTASDGDFVFENVPPGDYRVEQELPSGWRRSGPLASLELATDFTTIEGDAEFQGFAPESDWRLGPVSSGDLGNVSPHVATFSVPSPQGQAYRLQAGGRVTSPPIDLTRVSGTVLLELNHSLDLPSVDAASVIVVTDEGDSVLADNSSTSALTRTGSAFARTVLDVSGFTGQVIRIAFEVDPQSSGLRTETVAADLLEGETYFLRVESFEGQTLSGYELRATTPGTPPDSLQPNDDFDQATDLGHINRVRIQDLTIHSAGPGVSQNDFFRFMPQASGILRSSIRFSHALGDLDLFLYNSDRELVARSFSITDDESVAASVNDGETYYLEVRGYRGVTNPSYDLSVDGPGLIADDYEENDTPALATDLGVVIDRTESVLSIEENDEDWFRFQVNEPGTTEVEIHFQHQQGDLDLYVYDESLNLVTRSLSASDDERVSLTAVAGDTYFVQVAGFSGASNPQYSLTIDSPGIAPDRHEPNDSFESASELGSLGLRLKTDLTLDVSGDRDFFQFTPFQSGPSEFEIEFDPQAGDAYLSLYDADQNLIGSSRGTGWHLDEVQVVATGVHDLTLRAGDIVEELKFGNEISSLGGGAGRDGVISGKVYEDLNLNGVWDPDEVSLAGVEVFLDLDRNEVWSENEPIRTTTAEGYSFAGLGPGTYAVAMLGTVADEQTWPRKGQLIADPQLVAGTGDAPQSVVLADFNDDGDLDVAIANVGSGEVSGGVSIFLSNSAGGFQSRVDIGVGTGVAQLVSGNFDDDPGIDLAVLGHLDDTVTFLFNREGQFTADLDRRLTIGLDKTPNSLVAGHFDNDDRLDLAITSLGDSPGVSGAVTVFYQEGSGFRQEKLEIGGYPISVTAGNFTGSPTAEIAVADLGLGNSHGSVSILRRGSEEFSVAETFAAGRLFAIASGDFLDNGLDQVAVADMRGGVSVYARQFDGSFLATTADIDAGATSLATVDFDRDGQLDILVGTIRTDTGQQSGIEYGAEILRNLGGTFESRPISGVASFASDIATAMESYAVAAGETQSAELDRTQGPSVAVLRRQGEQLLIFGGQLVPSAAVASVGTNETRDSVDFGFVPAFRRIELSNLLVDENSADLEASPVGTLSVADREGKVYSDYSFTLAEDPGVGSYDNEHFEIVDEQLLRVIAGTALDFESQSTYQVLIRAEDSSGQSMNSLLEVHVVEPPEPARVASLTVGDGSEQRSRVETLTVEFDSEVQFVAGAFEVSRLGDAGGPVAVAVTAETVGGHTVARLHFGGPFSDFGSLADGNYQLRIDGSKVSRPSGELLDANGDGVGGGELLFGDRAVDNFFRLFGDRDGDRDVDGQNLGRFGLTFRKNQADPSFDRSFDFDADGDVDGADLGQFGLRFRTRLDY